MKKFVSAIVIILSLCNKGFCQDIYTYVNSTVGIPTYVDPLIPVYSPLTAIGTGTTTPCTWGFSGITGFTGLTYSPSGPCIEVSLTASPGYTINATGFTAGLRRSTTGPVMARMAYSTDGVAWIDDGVDHVPFNGSCATTTAGTTLASWTTFSVTNPTLYFRIYPFGASGFGGTIQIYGLDIIGNVHLICTTPTISVTPTTSSICSGGPGVALTGSGAGIGGTYTWSPAAGLSATTGATVTATPIATTVYTVTGTVLGGCNNTATSTVTVNPLPLTAVIPSGPLTFCTGGSVTLNAPVLGGYIYQWYNGITAIPGATSASYTATTSGSYKVKITNGFGCTATSASLVVTVALYPTITVTPPSGTVCLGSGISLTASGAGIGGTYTWSPPAGLSVTTGATVTASPLTTSTYSVTGTTAAGCATTSTVTVTVNPAPPATVTVSGPATFCAGGSVSLTAPAGYSYQWYNGASAIAGATNVSYLATVSGNYTVVVTGLGCSRTSAITVVNVLPLPPATVIPSGPLTFCTGSNVVLNAPLSGISYQWYNWSSVISGATTGSFVATTSGNYLVTITGINGCTAISNLNRVVSVSLPDVAVTPGTTFCEGTPGALTVILDGAATGITYQWKRNSINVAGATSYVYHPVSSGIYTCDVYVGGSCTYTTLPKTITVQTAPHPVITYSDGVLSTANSYSSYQWYQNGFVIPGATTNRYTPLTNGNYRVLVDSGSCSAYSFTYNFYTVSVNMVEKIDYQIYPNPATTMIHIESAIPVHARIFGLEGKLMLDQANAQDMDIRNLPAGVYLIAIYDSEDKKIGIEKLIKQ